MAVYVTDGIAWKQFAVWGGGATPTCRGPVRKILTEFLPTFLKINRRRIRQWHYLFEPECLIRFASPQPEAVFKSASRQAKLLGLNFERGCRYSEDGTPAEDYGEELDVYKDRERFDLSIALLHKSSEFFLRVMQEDTEPDDRHSTADMLWKIVHLMINQTGVTDCVEESWVYNQMAFMRGLLMMDERDLEKSMLFHHVPAIESSDHHRRG